MLLFFCNITDPNKTMTPLIHTGKESEPFQHIIIDKNVSSLLYDFCSSCFFAASSKLFASRRLRQKNFILLFASVFFETRHGLFFERFHAVSRYQYEAGDLLLSMPYTHREQSRPIIGKLKPLDKTKIYSILPIKL